MPDSTVIEVTIADLPEVKAVLDAQSQRIAELECELEESERRYDWLLGQAGGTV